MIKNPFSLYAAAFAALLLLSGLSLSIGVAEFSWTQVFAPSDSLRLMVVSRLPRTFAVVLSGASLAVAGMIMQILMRNRFVEPSMVGASQSAALALVLLTLVYPAAVYGADFAPAADGAADGAFGGDYFRRRNRIADAVCRL